MYKSHPSTKRTPTFSLIFWNQATLKMWKSHTHVQEAPQLLVLNFGTKRCVLYTGGYGRLPITVWGPRAPLTLLMNAIRFTGNARWRHGKVQLNAQLHLSTVPKQQTHSAQGNTQYVRVCSGYVNTAVFTLGDARSFLFFFELTSKIPSLGPLVKF